MLEHKKEGILVVLSGPSGAGKGTLVDYLREEIDIQYSTSTTTRDPRPGEIDGVSYFFTDKDSFRQGIKEDAFLEWAEVYGQYYGTPRAAVEASLEKGFDVMLEIDPQGAKQVKLKMNEAVLVFIMPPSYAELERRIRGRGTETEEQILRRLGGAMNEINTLGAYDYIIVNDDIHEALADLKAIINAEKCKVSHNTSIPIQFRKEKELSKNDPTQH